jgi:hypothetical protein
MDVATEIEGIVVGGMGRVGWQWLMLVTAFVGLSCARLQYFLL